MSANLTPRDAIYRRKEERRRNLAALTVEEKVAILIELQQLASQVAKEVGRPCQLPWGAEEAEPGQS